MTSGEVYAFVVLGETGRFHPALNLDQRMRQGGSVQYLLHVRLTEQIGGGKTTDRGNIAPVQIEQ